MDRRIGWSDVSYRHKREDGAESWVPEARIILYDHSFCAEQETFLPNQEHDRIKQGEILYQTPEEAHERIHELIVQYVCKKWCAPEDEIREYQCGFGHAFLLT